MSLLEISLVTRFSLVKKKTFGDDGHHYTLCSFLFHSCVEM
jgi:hypothetical protein